MRAQQPAHVGAEDRDRDHVLDRLDGRRPRSSRTSPARRDLAGTERRQRDRAAVDVLVHVPARGRSGPRSRCRPNRPRGTRSRPRRSSRGTVTSATCARSSAPKASRTPAPLGAGRSSLRSWSPRHWGYHTRLRGLHGTVAIATDLARSVDLPARCDWEMCTSMPNKPPLSGAGRPSPDSAREPGQRNGDGTRSGAVQRGLARLAPRPQPEPAHERRDETDRDRDRERDQEHAGGDHEHVDRRRGRRAPT